MITAEPTSRMDWDRGRRHRLVTPSRLGRLAVVYLRQSTRAQVEKNWGSTAVQRDQRSLAVEYGWPAESILVVEEDLGRSGSSTEQRTGWQEMCRLIADNRVGAVFAMNEARLARQLLDFEGLRVLCRFHDALLVLDGRPVDADDPGEVATTQIKASIAQLENQMRVDTMSRARRAKARSGQTVSRLPVGWITLPDGTYDFDPEARAEISELFARFWEAGSVRALVRMLDREGKHRPVRQGRQVVRKRLDAQAVRFILQHPAYAGDYVYGRSESRPDLGQRPNGHSRRAPAPPDQAIVIRDHHPAYVSRAEQQRIVERINANRFPTRAGRGAALLQSVVSCMRCHRAMSVIYPRAKGHRHRYHCLHESTSYGGTICTSVVGADIDVAVERVLLKEVQMPPVDVLRKALADADAAVARRIEEVETTRRRLAYEARIARERFEQCDPHNRLVAAVYEREYNRALEEGAEFERRRATQPPLPSAEGSEEELQALVQIAADVPQLWHHSGVTPQDRKEILRCLVDRVLIAATEDRIEGTIVWLSGARTAFFLHRRAGVYDLIKHLHAEGRTVREIQAWLAAGDPDTGQRWDYVRKHIYVIHEKLGLRPNERRAFRPELLEEVHRLHGQGLRARAVADALNRRGLTTPTGRPWTKDSVRHALKPAEKRFSRRRRAGRVSH
jgi:DNA invertase Pin-like site-specific DNA recombinase